MLEKCDHTSLAKSIHFCAQNKRPDPRSGLGLRTGIFPTENQKYIAVQMKGNRESTGFNLGISLIT